jgi:RNA polymerase sigma-70 factor (ECF subfamily)
MSVEKLTEHSISKINSTVEDLLTPEALYNDEEAFELLRRMNMRFIRSIVGPNTFTREDVEDLCQQAFEKALINSASFTRERGTFVNWLLEITHNTVIDEIRKRNRRPQIQYHQSNHYRHNVDDNFEDTGDILNELISDVPTPEETVIATEETDSVHAAVRALPDFQREVIELNFFGELSDSAISERIGIPLGTVKTRRRLGLQKLKTMFEEQNGEKR